MIFMVIFMALRRGRILLFFGKVKKSERKGEMLMLTSPAAGRNGEKNESCA